MKNKHSYNLIEEYEKKLMQQLFPSKEVQQ